MDSGSEQLGNIEILVSNGLRNFLLSFKIAKFDESVRNKKTIPNDNMNFKSVAVNNDDNSNRTIVQFNLQWQSISAQFIRIVLHGKVLNFW